jgi:hypothetical protein
MTRVGCAVVLVFVLAGSAHALTAVRPIEGYVCMNLKWTGTEEDMWDETKMPSVYAGPSASSKRIGSVGATAIVASPLHVEHGFAEILHLNGKKAWIQADLLLPYSVPGKANARCVPSIMSDGRIGMSHPDR